MKEDGETRSIRKTMGEMFEREGMQEMGKLLLIKENWKAIAGEDLAGKAEPYRLDRGRLFVGVGSHAIVQDALFHVEELKRAIKDGLGMEIEEVIVKKINLK